MDLDYRQPSDTKSQATCRSSAQKKRLIRLMSYVFVRDNVS